MLHRSRILLIGSGRLARHLEFYLQSQNHLELFTWSRAMGTTNDLHNLIGKVDLVALAISDSALADFARTYKHLNSNIPWIHFSGALVLPGLQSFHPLMTFGADLYDLNFYRQIVFVCEDTSPGNQRPVEWPSALRLSNPLYALAANQKPLYHALCVLSGNFSTLLWQKAQMEFQNLGLPPQILRLYAERCLRNVFENPDTALTGPLARRDLFTQEQNLTALGDDPFAEVYRAFQKAYSEDLLLQAPQTSASNKGFNT